MSKPNGLKRWKVMEHFLKICQERGVDPQLIDFNSIYEPGLDYWENVAKIDAAVPATQKEAIEKGVAYAEEMDFWMNQVALLREEMDRAWREKGVPLEVYEELQGALGAAKREVEKWKEKAKEAEEKIPPVKPKAIEEAEAALTLIENMLGPGF